VWAKRKNGGANKVWGKRSRREKREDGMNSQIKNQEVLKRREVARRTKGCFGRGIHGLKWGGGEGKLKKRLEDAKKEVTARPQGSGEGGA